MLSKSDWFGIALTAIASGASFLMGGTIAGIACLVIGVVALVVWHRKRDDAPPRQELQKLDQWIVHNEIAGQDVMLTVELTPASKTGALGMRMMCLVTTPDGNTHVGSAGTGVGTTLALAAYYPTMFRGAPAPLTPGHYEVKWIMEAEVGTSKRRDVIAHDRFDIL